MILHLLLALARKQEFVEELVPYSTKKILMSSEKLSLRMDTSGIMKNILKTVVDTLPVGFKQLHPLEITCSGSGNTEP